MSKRLPIILIIVLTMSLRMKTVSAFGIPTVSPESSKTHVTIDFSGYTGGPARNWLQARGFTPEQDAKDAKLLGLSITKQRLTLEANGQMSGFLLNHSINLDDPKMIRINWGIKRYPLGASYEREVNNEALMLYVFFGTAKIPSGSILVPPSPYFIGFFLCQNDKVNVAYMGRYYHHSGRFVCLGKPNPGEMVVSEFDLDRAFKNYFHTSATPGITGIGFGVDTSKAGNSGESAAVVKSIELFSQGTGVRTASSSNPMRPVGASGRFSGLAQHRLE